MPAAGLHGDVFLDAPLALNLGVDRGEDRGRPVRGLEDTSSSTSPPPTSTTATNA
ncbi:MAG: hypothetical protein M3N47_12920 [Chloroflexota bacterium]|nr:hypothetical protein [Chloroflexota bacterium]